MPASADAPIESAAPVRTSALPRRRGIQAALLCLAAFGMAAAVAFGVFEATPHLEDEHANYFQARIFARR
jgi:hypothetical protein